MDISIFFKSVLDSDKAPVVLCNLEHIVVYMNLAAQERYKCDITGKSIKECHNTESCQKIEQVVNWFRQSNKNNSVFTYHNPKENKDVYMVALRNSQGKLIGYYEKHEYRTPESAQLYDMG